jgi:hypothetical protein
MTFPLKAKLLNSSKSEKAFRAGLKGVVLMRILPEKNAGPGGPRKPTSPG